MTRSNIEEGMGIPDVDEAQDLLSEAEQLNPGKWVAHSRNVALAARCLAEADATLEPDSAYVLGLLHDVGRREGWTSMRHIIDGYRFLQSKDYEDAARICLTHSFPLQDTDAVFGEWDCSADERAFVDRYIADATYTDYDRLLQLCDGLALPQGFVLLEKRMVDVALRYGTNDFTVARWRATFEIKEHFERRIDGSIYERLPGVVQNTFGDA